MTEKLTVPFGNLKTEIDLLRKQNAALLAALEEYMRDFGDNEDADSKRMAAKARAAIEQAKQ